MRLLFLCFLLSGAAGLIYEVVWARQMALFLGITTYANTAIITAFMIGLSIGSIFIGRLSDRFANPLWLYIVLEAGIGLYAALTPQLMVWLQDTYAQLGGLYGVTGTGSHILRFSLALLLLLIPTILMGGTLPVLVRALREYLPNLAEATGKLYGINTLGAAMGTFAAGYLLLPSLGISGTIYLTVVINFGVALTVWLLANRLSKSLQPTKKAKKKKQTEETVQIEVPRLSRRGMIVLAAGFVLSGFAALVYELAWIRSLTLVIGSSVYAFSTVLSTYLFGLAFGSLLYGRWSRGHRHSDPFMTASYLEVGIALSALGGLFVIPMLPELFLEAFRAGLQKNFALFQLYIFFLSFLLMIIPTLLLGVLFPLVTTVWAAQSKEIGRNVGSAYAFNTFGTIAGTIAGGLLLMRLIGVEYTIILGAAVHMIVAGLFWSLGSSGRQKSLVVSLSSIVLFVLLVLAVPPWNRALMTSGIFVYGQRLAAAKDKNVLKKSIDSRKILYYKEGIDGVVAVTEAKSGNRMLVINGKIDASSRQDLPTQVMAGEIPALIHPNPKRVLVVGLGSGIMAGSIATHKSVESIEILEISKGVVEASEYFKKQNYDILNDPRVDLIVADGRNYIAATTKKYDVIVSEPSNPWISGISNLFTREYFVSADKKLARDGIMMQWFQTYKMQREDVKSILHTFNSVYPYVSVWMPMAGDMVMIGSHKPHTLDLERLRKVMAEKQVKRDLERVGFYEVSDLLRTYLIGGAALKAYTKHARINSDDHPFIEFNAPKNLYSNTSLANIYDLSRFLNNIPLDLPVSHIAIREGKEIKMPVMHLDIETKQKVTPDKPIGKFQTTRQLRTGGKNAAMGVLVTHTALLTFDEGESHYIVSTGYFTNPLNEKTMQELLQNQFANGILRGGTVQMPGNKKAFWMQEKSRDLHLGTIWSCGSDENRTSLYHIALVKHKGKIDYNLGEELKAFTQKFKCR